MYFGTLQNFYRKLLYFYPQYKKVSFWNVQYKVQNSKLWQPRSFAWINPENREKNFGKYNYFFPWYFSNFVWFCVIFFFRSNLRSDEETWKISSEGTTLQRKIYLSFCWNFFFHKFFEKKRKNVFLSFFWEKLAKSRTKLDDSDPRFNEEDILNLRIFERNCFIRKSKYFSPKRDIS